MALNIKDPKAAALAAEVAELAGENKTQAIRTALQERKERLSLRGARRDKRVALLRFLETEVWPAVPRAELGKRLSRRAEERLLGYGRDGV